MHGTCIYIATRFYNRGEDVRQVQPGFLLALLECKVLQDAGCMVWDLGGVNLCPLMRYKWDLTGDPIERMVAMHVLQRAQSTCLSRTTPAVDNSEVPTVPCTSSAFAAEYTATSIATSANLSSAPMAHFAAGTIKEPVELSDLLY